MYKKATRAGVDFAINLIIEAMDTGTVGKDDRLVWNGYCKNKIGEFITQNDLNVRDLVHKIKGRNNVKIQLKYFPESTHIDVNITSLTKRLTTCVQGYKGGKYTLKNSRSFKSPSTTKQTSEDIFKVFVKTNYPEVVKAFVKQQAEKEINKLVEDKIEKLLKEF